MAKILIVDDSNFSRRVLRRILEGDGHLVIEAAEGLSALERYSLEKPDAVLIDLTMPGMSGLDLLTALHAMSPPARVMVATADIQTSVRDQVMQSGAAFVQKPFATDDVLSKLHALLSGQALER